MKKTNTKKVLLVFAAVMALGGILLAFAFAANRTFSLTDASSLAARNDTEETALLYDPCIHDWAESRETVDTGEYVWGQTERRLSLVISDGHAEGMRFYCTEVVEGSPDCSIEIEAFLSSDENVNHPNPSSDFSPQQETVMGYLWHPYLQTIVTRTCNHCGEVRQQVRAADEETNSSRCRPGAC